MRLLLDMGLAPRTAEFLRANGHDAVHLRDQGLHRFTDAQIMEKAAAEQRVVVTFDLDFPRLIALERAASPSVILLRLEQFTTDAVNVWLLDLVAKFSEPLMAGAIVVLDTGVIRVRRLPIL